MKKLEYDLDKIFDVLLAFSSKSTYAELLNTMLTKMMELTNSDGGTLYTVEDDTLCFRIIRNKSLNIFRSLDEKIDLPPIILDEGNIENVSAYAAIKNEIVAIDDVYNSEKFNFSGPKNYDKITGYRTRSMLVLPLTATTDGTIEVTGVIQLINATDKDTGEITSFGDVLNPPILPALANISANTFANVKYTKEIKELFNSFVGVMTKAIDERSPYNRNHTGNVAKYCERFTGFLNNLFPDGHTFYFNKNRREQLVMAAFLHDIGKIITPLHVMDKPDRLGEEIKIIKLKFEIKRQQLENDYLKNKLDETQYEKSLTELDDALELISSSNAAGFLPNEKIESIKKLELITYIDGNGETAPLLTPDNIESLSVQKGTLTDAERQIMQEHVSVTGRLLDEMIFNHYFKDVPGWASGHHEFLDGTGYPNGLRDGQIPMEVSILTIMDIYDALTASDRPYKKAMPVPKALEILSSMAEEGKLHKELVTLFAGSNIWETKEVAEDVKG